MGRGSKGVLGRNSSRSLLQGGRGLGEAYPDAKSFLIDNRKDRLMGFSLSGSLLMGASEEG